MARRSVPAVITFEDQSGGAPPEIWPSPGVPTPPIYYPPEIWPTPPAKPPLGIWGPSGPWPTPPIVVVPPGELAPGVPSHPIVIPPEQLPPVPGHPIVLPPETPGEPPVVLPPLPPEIWPPAGVVTPPIYYPPEIWPKPPEKPTEPPAGGGGSDKFMWKAIWTPRTGWLVILVPLGPVPTPSAAKK